MQVSNKPNSSLRWLTLLCFIAFIALGMPDGLLGVAWPSIRISFKQELDSLAWLLFGGTIGYLISSFSSGWIMQNLGVGRMLSFSLILTGLVLLSYTFAPVWWLMIPLATLAGIGAGAIDAGLNAWVDNHLDQHLMHWLHGSYGIGITAGPIIMTLGLALSTSWRPGYWIVACIQLALGIVFLFKSKLWSSASQAQHAKTSSGAESPPAPFSETIRLPKAWASSLLFFVYTGIEIGMGHWAYSWMITDLAYSPTQAGIWTSAYWGAFTIGRFSAGWINRRLPSQKILPLSLGLAVIVTLLLAIIPIVELKGPLLAILGLAIAPSFPSMVSTTALRVGRSHAQSTIGMQLSMAGLGVGLVPGLMGVIAKNFGLSTIPWIASGLGIVLLILILLFKAEVTE